MYKRTLSVKAAADVAGSLGPAVSPPVTDPLASIDARAVIGRLMKQFLFKPDYVQHVIAPFFMMSMNQGERLSLPMIDVTLTKENALPYYLLGLLYENWKPDPDEGVTASSNAWRNADPIIVGKNLHVCSDA